MSMEGGVNAAAAAATAAAAAATAAKVRLHRLGTKQLDAGRSEPGATVHDAVVAHLLTLADVVVPLTVECVPALCAANRRPAVHVVAQHATHVVVLERATATEVAVGAEVEVAAHDGVRQRRHDSRGDLELLQPHRARVEGLEMCSADHELATRHGVGARTEQRATHFGGERVLGKRACQILPGKHHAPIGAHRERRHVIVLCKILSFGE
mmetsp:Transcript_335/g.951  ORF Transcript_335/g.951 Transcript_335/m.951 type:complete len:210 (-) Transcript_335:187-816(-)